MKKFVVHYSNSTDLTYNLIDEEIVNQWGNLITYHSIDDLCPINHYVGYASNDLIDEKIVRLLYLADLINTHVPNRVIKQPVSRQSWKKELHIMHVHFPELKNNVNYKHIWNELTEYNDIIHWLEAVLSSTGSNSFRITLDFNKKTHKFLPIPESAYKLFTPHVNFGDLFLHYTHVGKHPHEIFSMNDLICPADQLVPQREFSASVRMSFTNNFHDTTIKQQDYMSLWQKFYNLRGKEFWRHDIDDPKLSFGYMKIGELINKPAENELNKFRENLAKSKVLGWKIIDHF